MPNLRYFHVPPGQIQNNTVSISGKELHHLSKVLRLGEGDEVAILDGAGGIHRAMLNSVNRREAIGRILDSEKAEKPPVSINIFVGLPKSDKMDMIIQKATEIGADSIIPMICQYSVPVLSHQREQKRINRWKLISIEAAKQSRRPYFPFISDFTSFSESITKNLDRPRIIFVARSDMVGTIKKLRDVFKHDTDIQKFDLFIGPEGGFSDEEIKLSISSDAIPVTLGKNIMRTETAVIAALSIAIYELDPTTR